MLLFVFSGFTITINALLISLALIYAALMLLYILGWHRLPSITVTPHFTPNQFFTVVVPARNEQQNIEKCINSIAKQNYPSNLFEVIVVNDHSEDETLAILKQLKKQYAWLNIINLADYVADETKQNSFKKLAIHLAIQQAKGDIIATTDADCEVPQNWLRNFAYVFKTKKAQFVTGPVKFTYKNNWLQKFQTLDFAGMMCVTGASLHWRISYMSNGANLAYKKEVYKEVKGFEGIDHIASGDDLLLMEKIVSKYPNDIYFLKSKMAIVKTKALDNLKSFFNQRVRWASKSKQYQNLGIKLILSLVYLFNFLVLFGLPLVLVQLMSVKLWIAAFLIKIVADFAFLRAICGFFDERQLLRGFFQSQLLHLIYIVSVGLWGNWAKYQWKGRKVR